MDLQRYYNAITVSRCVQSDDSTKTRRRLSSADATLTTTTLPSAPKCCFTGNATRGRACVSVRTNERLQQIFVVVLKGICQDG
ncbi:hypothetical protein B5X24_HaOG214765 [Helicoverpa armigera]|uniref:Uncharacterized protein n=1 Tax=Helicoverpa armigera TaxID=29058 RepID=A0A2W1B6G6_HELAM|nr:hypothetical protein B5X24_HaOG214765 [Helicoverpa armigera]